LQKYYLRTSRQMRLLDLEAKSPLYSHFLESLTGLVEIRAFGWSNDFLVSQLVSLSSDEIKYHPYWTFPGADFHTIDKEPGSPGRLAETILPALLHPTLAFVYLRSHGDGASGGLDGPCGQASKCSLVEFLRPQHSLFYSARILVLDMLVWLCST
jgi:hypothetical protein